MPTRIGMAADPLNETELAFVNEASALPRPVKVVPTFSCCLGR